MQFVIFCYSSWGSSLVFYSWKHTLMQTNERDNLRGTALSTLFKKKKKFPNLTILNVICNNLWHTLQPITIHPSNHPTTWPRNCQSHPNTLILLRKWKSQQMALCSSSHLAYRVLASSLSTGRKRQPKECRGHLIITHINPQIFPLTPV